MSKNLIKILLTAVLLCTGGICSRADDTVEIPPTKGYLKPIGGSGSVGSRTPGKSVMKFDVCGGVLSISPIIGGFLQVTVTNDASGETWTGSVSPDIPYMDGPDEPGSYSITCLNPEGQSYIGFFEL